MAKKLGESKKLVSFGGQPITNRRSVRYNVTLYWLPLGEYEEYDETIETSWVYSGYGEVRFEIDGKTRVIPSCNLYYFEVEEIEDNGQS